RNSQRRANIFGVAMRSTLSTGIGSKLAIISASSRRAFAPAATSIDPIKGCSPGSRQTNLHVRPRAPVAAFHTLKEAPRLPSPSSRSPDLRILPGGADGTRQPLKRAVAYQTAPRPAGRAADARM